MNGLLVIDKPGIGADLLARRCEPRAEVVPAEKTKIGRGHRRARPAPRRACSSVGCVGQATRLADYV